MNNDDINLEERFKTLPKDVRDSLTSLETAEKIKAIGSKHGLKLDQESVLFDKIADVMFGILESREFVKTFSQEAGVDMTTAKLIAEDANTEIFNNLKSVMQNPNQTAEPAKMDVPMTQEPVSINSTVSSLEQAGDFTIERESAKEAILEGKNPVTPRDRADLIAGLENPAPVVPRMASRGTDMTNGNGHTPMTEPLVDQLLHNSTAIPHEKITQEPEKTDSSQTPIPPKAPTGSDPYREAV